MLLSKSWTDFWPEASWKFPYSARAALSPAWQGNVLNMPRWAFPQEGPTGARMNQAEGAWAESAVRDSARSKPGWELRTGMEAGSQYWGPWTWERGCHFLLMMRICSLCDQIMYPPPSLILPYTPQLTLDSWSLCALVSKGNKAHVVKTSPWICAYEMQYFL